LKSKGTYVVVRALADDGELLVSSNALKL